MKKRVKYRKKYSIIGFAIIVLIILCYIIANNQANLSGKAIFEGIFGKIFFSTSSLGRVFIGLVFMINIDSPQNTTYNFAIGSNYTLDLNVSSNRNVTSWNYTLFDIKHNITINNSASFYPNSTFKAVRWSNILTVIARDNYGNINNKSLIFYVNVSNSAPIIHDLRNILACENTSLDYFFNVTDIDEDNLTGAILPINPFYISTTPYRTINNTYFEFYIYSGIIGKNTIGGVNKGYYNYSETITIYDPNSGVASSYINITVIEINNPPYFVNIGVKTVWTYGENTTFYHKADVSDIEDGNQDSGNLSFTITNSGNLSINISSNGVMNFTPNMSMIGVYNVSVCAIDAGLKYPHENISFCNSTGSNRTTCNNFSLTITDINRRPYFVSYTPQLEFNISTASALGITFNITTRDPELTIPDVYWSVDGTNMEYDTGSLLNYFYYTFPCSDSGIHHVVANITDGALYNFLEWNITLEPSLCSVVVVPGGGGGGGGGSSAPKCKPKWGCEEFGQCMRLELNLSLGLDIKNIIEISNICRYINWSDDFCGYQTRKCVDLNNCTNINKFNLPVLVRECYYTFYPDCFDKIKNCHNGSCEILVDCGGPCSPCPTCTDNIKNQGEEDIDCGGPCSPCKKESPEKIRRTVNYLLMLFILILFLIILFFIVYFRKKRHIERILSNKPFRKKIKKIS
ncbi:MAG: hypothetical protein Q8N99_05215 [Nanoarchaeota archaeon]|nr:hypothetical protein [Nanoarchaeota archaeon]